jgi:hypothetical protein
MELDLGEFVWLMSGTPFDPEADWTKKGGKYLFGYRVEKMCNRILSKLRCPVERVFGTLKRSYRYSRARYLGLRKNGFQLTMLNVYQIAAGKDGIIVEMQPDPDTALTDAQQTISPEVFQEMMSEVLAIHNVLKKVVIQAR